MSNAISKYPEDLGGTGWPREPGFVTYISAGYKEVVVVAQQRTNIAEKK